jgi:hypothetical protein
MVVETVETRLRLMELLILAVVVVDRPLTQALVQAVDQVLFTFAIQVL